MKYANRFLSLLIASVFLLSSCSSVLANERIIFFDDFNDREIFDWTVARNLQWNNTTLPCKIGSSPAVWSATSTALVFAISGPPCVSELTPNNLDLSERQTYILDFDWTFESSMHMDRNFALLWKDEENWIGLKIIDQSIIIQKVMDGNDHVVNGSSVSYPFSANKTYHFSIEYSKNNHIIVSIDDEKIIDVIDLEDTESYSGNYSFAFQASVGSISSSTTKFDNIVVTTEDEKLGVPLIKQGALPWGPMDYDSTRDWSTPEQGYSFKDWGCALTSAVMIMNYHGITTLLDGTPISPLSLNNWMLENKGYIHGGNVNFPVLAALTKKISDEYGTAALEYKRQDAVPADNLALAKNEIAAGRPVIVKKPGHFMVADGIVTDAEDLYIKDPAYTFTQFSEHNADLVSTRTFAPSFTDVSYLQIAADTNAQIELFDETGHLLEVTPTVEFVENPEVPGEMSPAVQMIEIPQPAVGVYKMVQHFPEQTPLSTTITTITLSGDVTQHTVESSQSEVLLSYKADEPSVIEIVTLEGFGKLRVIIGELRQKNEIKTELAFLILDQLAAYGVESDDSVEKFIITKVIRQVTNNFFSRHQLTVAAKQAIIQELNALRDEYKLEALPKIHSTPKPSGKK